MNLNSTKARLGSIAPSVMASLPGSVQRLLNRDLPRLIELVEAADEWVEGYLKVEPYLEADESYRSFLGYKLLREKEGL